MRPNLSLSAALPLCLVLACVEGPPEPGPTAGPDLVRTVQNVAPGGSCTADAQCDSDGLQCHVAVCRGGKCRIDNAPNNSACNDGNPCTTGDKCSGSGTCGGTTVTCAAPNDCNTASCNPATGACDVITPVADNKPCNDNNRCTNPDKCIAGQCQGTQSVFCTGDQCHSAGTCNPATGACGTGPALADGTPCSDNNSCTQTDTCQGGSCTGANPVSCAPLDQCHLVGLCDTTTGLCSNPPAPDGSSCTDLDACTDGDSCQSGACVPGTPVTCKDFGQCMSTAVCNPLTGQCSATPLPLGSRCSDGNPCTTGDQCDGNGVCGGTAVSCPAPNDCNTASCNPATGACDVITPVADDTPCNDNDGCTQKDTCQGGTCTGAAPVSCTALDQCHLAGVCDRTTGLCSNPPKPDGTSCTDRDACTDGDTCQSGACQSGTLRSCPDLGPCFASSICDSATGECSRTQLEDGSRCSDGDPCTENDSCSNGTCAGTAVNCPSPRECVAPGTCNRTTGKCDYEYIPNFSPCSDGNACTAGDFCMEGVCESGPGNPCTPDQCHTGGTCDAATGTCSGFIARPDGTACDDGDLCTLRDSCTSGSCGGTEKDCSVATGTCQVGGTCDSRTGLCSGSGPASDGTPCDDGNPCTTDDACRGGECNGTGTPGVNVTRTLGFYMTHEDATQQCLDQGAVSVGSLQISTLSRALGLLWASPAKFADGTRRTGVDKADFLAERQLFVAICNQRLFGATPPGTLIADAQTALAGTDCTALGSIADALDAFNNSGDAQPLLSTFDPGPAKPQDAKALGVDPTSATGRSCSTGGAP